MDLNGAISSFDPADTAKGGEAADVLLQCTDDSLMATQVRSLFQMLMEQVGGVPVGPDAPESVPTVWRNSSSIAELVGAALNEGMKGAEDGDVTGRGLKFSVLCNLLATFLGLQNHTVLGTIRDCVDNALASLLPTTGSRVCLSAA